MNDIDLHVHSNASDGTLTPSQVIDLAVSVQLSAIALTDHDTLDGIEEASKAAENWTKNGHPIRLIPGTELSVAYKNKDIHILGLFLDPNHKTLLEELRIAREKRDSRNDKMAQNLRDAGIDISMEQLRKEEGDAVLTRAHFAKFLTSHGYTKTTKDAFTKYLGQDTPYYVKREYLTPKRGIELIHEAGGLAILAHPLLYKFSLNEIEELVAYLCEFNLDGIEAIYSLNTAFDEGHIRRIANKYNLVISGGSDFHGANKPDIKLGKGFGNLKIPFSILEQLEERKKAFTK